MKTLTVAALLLFTFLLGAATAAIAADYLGVG